MEDPDFDQQLRHLISSQPLPYESAAWREVHQRLDSRERGLLLRRRRVHILLKPALAAAVLLIAVLLIRWPDQRDHKMMTQRRQLPVDKRPLTGNKEKDINTTLPQRPLTHTAAQAVIATGKPVVQADTAPHIPATTITKTPGQSPGPLTTKNKEGLLPDPGLLIRDHYLAPELQAERRLFIDVSGGYNLNTAGNGFSVGLNVRRNLSRRFRFDAGMNLMSGQNHSYRKQEYNPSQQGPDQYSPATDPVLYLQASPSVSYRLFKNMYTGAGMDVQRLVTGTSRGLILDSTGTVTGSQPAWDFGFMLRMDYQVSPRIKAGLSYRESLGGFSSGTSHVVSRDYMLVQVSYNLY